MPHLNKTKHLEYCRNYYLQHRQRLKELNLKNYYKKINLNTNQITILKINK